MSECNNNNKIKNLIITGSIYIQNRTRLFDIVQNRTRLFDIVNFSKSQCICHSLPSSARFGKVNFTA